MLMTALVALTIAPGAPDLKVPAKGAEEPIVVGEWTVEGRVVGGKPVIINQPYTIEMTADGAVNFRQYGKILASSVYKVGSGKTPVEFDWTVVPGQNPMPGIVKVEKDTMTLCVDPDGKRPTKFDSPDGSQVTVWTLKRVPKKD